MQRDLGEHPLSGPVYTGDPKPSGCGTCTKTAAQLERLQHGAWECSHVACPHRRTCWSDGTGTGRRDPQPQHRDPLDRLFSRSE